METLYIHEKTGNIQPMTEATVKILGGGWRKATEEDIAKQTKVVQTSQPSYLPEKSETPKVEKVGEVVPTGEEEEQNEPTGTGEENPADETQNEQTVEQPQTQTQPPAPKVAAPVTAPKVEKVVTPAAPKKVTPPAPKVEKKALTAEEAAKL